MTADHQTIPIADHFVAYLNHVRVTGVTALHVADVERKVNKLFRECDFATRQDIHAEMVENWVSARQTVRMAARSRNAHLQAVRGFCK